MSGWNRIIALWVAAGTAVFGASNDTIAGTVVATDGKPVAAILILHDLSTSRVVGSHAFDHQFSSKSDGTFSLANVPEGQYEICVDAPQQAIVDPCFWSAGRADVITTGRGASSSHIRMKVERGYILQVRVNDPEAILPLIGGAAGPPLSIRVETPDKRSRSVRLLGTDQGGRTHFMVVPYDRPMTVTIQSPIHKLSDEKSARYDGDSARIPLRIAPGANIAPLVVNVGRR